VIAPATQLSLSEEAVDVLDSLRRLASATLAGLVGDTGRSRAETARALHELETAGLAELRAGGVWYPSQLAQVGPRTEEGVDAADRGLAEAAAGDPEAERGAGPPDAGVRGRDGRDRPEPAERGEPSAASRPGKGAGEAPLTPSEAEWGAWARARRLALGLSQDALAKRIGRSAAPISSMEIGRARERGLNWSTWRSDMEGVLGPYEAKKGGGMALEPDPPQSLSAEGSESTPPIAVSAVDQEARSRTATAGAVGAAGDVQFPSVCPGSPGEPSSTEFLNVSVGGPTLVGGACVAPGGVAQPAELSADSRAGRTSSPRERASSAGSPATREPEPGVSPPPLAADPVRPAAVPAEVPPAAVPVGVARQQDGSGAPESSPPEIDARPQTDVGARERDDFSPGSTVEVNLSLFNKVCEQNEQIATLREDRNGWETLAEERGGELYQVRATLDRLGVPAGALVWRLGWLEGRVWRGDGR
jgi:hypothetical protein